MLVRASRFGGASPRERRNQSYDAGNQTATRRISARAEEPAGGVSVAIGIKAHLRASGGTGRRIKEHARI